MKLLRKVDYHQNIIHFYGITKKESMFKLFPILIFFFLLTEILYLLKGDDEEYLLVLEYADSGTLRRYLEKTFESISWSLKLKFAHEITSAVMCLHENDIIHRDLVNKLHKFMIFFKKRFIHI